MMTIAALQAKLETALGRKVGRCDAGQSELRRLFDLNAEIDREVRAMRALPDPSPNRMLALDAIRQDILGLARVLPASTQSDVLLKLAIWRWGHTHLDQPVETMRPLDALVFTAFFNLAQLNGDTSVINGFDLARDDERRVRQVR